MALGAMLVVGSAGSAFAPALAASSQASATSGALHRASPSTAPRRDGSLAEDARDEAEETFEFDAPQQKPTGVEPARQASLVEPLHTGSEKPRAEPPVLRLSPGLGGPAPQADPRPDELLQFGQVKVPRSLVATIVRAADEIGVDAVYMMALADKESSFDPEVKAATSSAEGLYQFIDATWLEMMRDFGAKHGYASAGASISMVKGQIAIQDDVMREYVFGLRRNPYLASLMAAEMLKRDRARVERRIGRDLTRAESYLLHFLGAASAGRLMEKVTEKPKQSAPKAFPKAAKANKTLFFDKKGKKTRHLSVAEVYDRLDRMIDKRLDRYLDVMDMRASVGR